MTLPACRFSRLLGVGLAAVANVLAATRAEARPCEQYCSSNWPGWAPTSTFAVVPGFSVRNDDWAAVDGMGILLLPAPAWDRMAALVVRGEVGLGGSSAGIGLATNAFDRGGCPRLQGCGMSEFLGSGILSLEGRVERMYGLTTWRDTTYVGWQLSLAGIIWKPAFGWMVAADNPRDRHWQITLFGGGW